MDHFRKAVKALVSIGIAEPSAETSLILQEKHPIGPLPIDHDLTDIQATTVTIEEITNAIQYFPKNTACAKSGQRVTLIIEMLSAGISLDIDFTTFINNQEKAPLKLAPLYASANEMNILFYPTNCSGRDNMRADFQTVLRKVISRAIAYLAPFQRGIGVLDAKESIVHGLNSLFQGNDLDKNTVVLLLDFENAFNNIGRQFFINEVFR
jgi:hypothetical protein